MPPTAPFELDFDKFDMLTEFPELDQHYHSQNSGGGGQSGNNSGMIHHGTSGPLLSSTMTATTPPGGGSKRHHIAEYSPDWAWSDVSVIYCGILGFKLCIVNDSLIFQDSIEAL